VPPAYLRKQIFLPQDHGSWVFILSPLLVGLYAAGQFTFASLSLVVASLAAFLVRQPITLAVKAYSGRRAKSDVPAALFWVALYGLIIFIALLGLLRAGFAYLLLLAIPGVPVFAWHLSLVSRREERRQVNVEIIATGVLSLTAPAAYWVGIGRYDSVGWWLWLLVWFQTAASIVYTYLRLEQRDLVEDLGRNELWKMGSRAFAYTTFNLVVVLVLGLLSVLPRFLFLPYFVQWLETLWGIFHPAIKWKPTRIGIRQLIVSISWTILFIITWVS
jgi:YwiC-like protein